jgi:hypothetical protein
MKQQVDCPICGGMEARISWALVAPFLKRYALDADAQRTAQLRECKTCGHRFFRERMSVHELNRLYRDYRGERYLQVRQRWEPWYTQAVNATTLQADVAEARREALRNLLRQAGWAQGERRLIVDIGGDRGQCIPQDFSNGAYVLETSAVPCLPWVQRISSLAELPRPAGLVLCLHVLEHLPDPASFLKEIVQSGQLERGCLVVLEVPLERPWLGPALASTTYRGWLDLLGRWPWLALGLDLPATVARLMLGVVMPPLFLKLHEHVGFFTEDSLVRIAHSAGLEVLLAATFRERRWRQHHGLLRVVAHVR